MIEKTGIIYSENEDLSNSQTIEQVGEQSSITVPDMRRTDFYVKAYCVESGITYESSVEHYVAPLEYFQINNEYAGTNTITLTTSKNGSPTVGTYATSVEYSKDGENWTTISLNTGSRTISLNQGEYVYLRNDNGYWNNNEAWNVYYRTVITASQNFSVQGNIKTLLDYTSNTPLSNGCFSYLFQNATKLTNTPDLEETTLSDYCYYYMFSGCTGITSVPTLPATTLTQYCYSNMFNGCTGITSVPTLAATTLADSCYYQMFRGCTGITTLSTLPATTLENGCYASMFSNCTGITTIPSNMLPATTLENSCYGGMFSFCTSLTTVPSDMLPATTLADSCYGSMFNGCTSLTNTPTFPAITTAPYRSFGTMFSNCTSLTNAPVLPPTTLGEECYVSMFSGCSNLMTIPSNMLPATTMVSRCYSGMFIGCTSLTTVPSDMLPATTMANGCYHSMFSRAGIIKGPDLPATNLIGLTSCYAEMFRYCPSINELSVYVNKPSGTGANVGANTNLMFDSVTTTGTLHNLGSAPNNDWRSSSVKLPSTWTIVNS